MLGPCPATFFVMADLAANSRAARYKAKKPAVISPLALESVPDRRPARDRARHQRRDSRTAAVRQELSAALIADLKVWMREQRGKLSRATTLPKRWTTCSSAGMRSHFLDDGRICLSNNTAERALLGIALGRKSQLFCGPRRHKLRSKYTSKRQSKGRRAALDATPIFSANARQH